MTPPVKLRRTDFYPDDWIAGTMELTLEEEGAYIRICALIYSKGKPILDNDRWLAGMCRVSTRKWRLLRQALINKQKITISDGVIHQERCRKELEKAMEVSRKRAESGSKGGQTTATRYTKPNKNKTPEPANATAGLNLARATPSPSPSPSTSKKDYAFAGKVIKLSEKDLTTWRNSYSAIPDIRASLQSRDDWLATQPEGDQRKWFISTSVVLKREHERALADRERERGSQHASGAIY